MMNSGADISSTLGGTYAITPDLRPTLTAGSLEVKLNDDGTSEVMPPKDWRGRYIVPHKKRDPAFPKLKSGKKKKKQHKIYKKKGLSR